MCMIMFCLIKARHNVHPSWFFSVLAGAEQSHAGFWIAFLADVKLSWTRLTATKCRADEVLILLDQPPGQVAQQVRLLGVEL